MHLDGHNLANNVMAERRRERLSEYVNGKQFLSDMAYQQFEIASVHKIYYAVFDALLCLCWDEKKKLFLDRNKKKFKDNIMAFLKGYGSYIAKNTKEPCIAGLKRLAREFLFGWESIQNVIAKTDSQQLKDLYQEIINN